MRVRWSKLALVLTKAASPFWIAIRGIAVSCGLAFLTGFDLKTGILYAGTYLHFFGLVLVAKVISYARKQFGRPSLFPLKKAASPRAWRMQRSIPHKLTSTIVGRRVRANFVHPPDCFP